VPSLTPPPDVSGERLERRAALLSALDGGGPAPSAAGTLRELRRQAVVLSGATGGAARAFSLAAEPPRLRDRYGRHRSGQAMLLGVGSVGGAGPRARPPRAGPRLLRPDRRLPGVRPGGPGGHPRHGLSLHGARPGADDVRRAAAAPPAQYGARHQRAGVIRPP